MIKQHFLAIAALFLAFTTSAQIKMPAASPKFELKGSVGLCEVKVVYSRPSARGRQVAGKLIPYNEVWRTGANSSTKISFSEDVKLNGHEVPAGEYALYTHFTEEIATIILSKNLKLWGAMGYNPDEDQVRFDVPVKHPSSHYETFTISFSDFTRNSANLNMKWEHTKAMFKIETEVDSKVMADIKAQVIDKTPERPGIYYQAASYYYDTERDTEMALSWVDKAIEISEKEQYWVYNLKGKLLARAGKKKEAVETAKKTIELAKIAENWDYVRMNEALLSKLSSGHP